MNYNNNQVNFKPAHKNSHLTMGIIILLIVILGSTYAYFSFNATNSSITGNAGEVDLELTVTKVLPNTTGVDDILVINYNELAESLNNSCMDSYGDFSLCQLYKVTLENKSSSVNTDIQGSISFDNTTTPNLSWILVDNYNSSTTYTTTLLGSTYNTATSTFTNFVDSYLLNTNSTTDFYILIWVNETEEAQTDEGSYGGTIKFEDSNGQGVTATFNS